ncbi:MAG: sensor histidine kinase [Methanobacterium sp.]
MLYYALFVIGIIFLSTGTLKKINRVKTFIEMSIVIIAAALTFLALLVLPLLETSNSYSIEVTVSLYYIFLDFFLFITLINLIFRIGDQNEQTTLILLAMGILFQIITDFFYSFYTINGNFSSGGLIDVGWIIGYIFIGLAALSQVKNYRINFNQYMPKSNYFTKINWNFYLPLIFAFISYITLLWSFRKLSLEYVYLLEIGVGTIIFLVIMRQITVSKENITLYLAATDEINKRKVIEDELQKSEKKYREIVENANEGILSTDLESKIVFVNGRLMEILGYEENEIIGKHILELMDEESVETAKNCMMNVKNGIKGQNEFRLLKKDGGYMDVLINVSPVNESSYYNGCLALISDITEIKAAQTQIKNSLNEKEVLLREIHHRVKNNMQIISSMLSLQSNYISDEETLRIFKESQNRVKSMALVHEKLYKSNKLSEIAFGDYLNDILQYLLISYSLNPGLINFKINTHNISFSMDTAVPLCLIINELVSNSLKYAFPENSSFSNVKSRISEVSTNSNQVQNNIEIMIKPKDDKYEMIISDNGIGLPDDFDLYDSGTLGLNIVNVLVQQLGGSIEVLDVPGTAFKIIFKGN